MIGMALVGAMALTGCASAGDPKTTADAWVGGDQARLAADTAACHRDAADIDVNQAENYSDPRYGTTSAMAAAIAEDNPLTNTRPQIKAATFAACMSDKGWRQP
jgi:hypothetical protein